VADPERRPASIPQFFPCIEPGLALRQLLTSANL
jgi:hypothetical protein